MPWFGHKSFSFPYKQKSVLAWWDLESRRDDSSLVPAVLWTRSCISIIISYVVNGAENFKILKIQSFTFGLSVLILSHQHLHVVNIDVLLLALFTCFEGSIRMGLTCLLRRQNQKWKLLVVKNYISPVDFLPMYTTN